MSFLSMLLGSEPVHEPPTQLYQRMLSMESEEMFDLAAKYIEEHSLEEFYDAVFVPALLLSEEDRHRGDLAEVRQQFIFQSSRELIEELERQDEVTGPHTPGATVDLPPVHVVGLPARDEADELVALMLTHLLRRRGLPVHVHPVASPVDETLRNLEQDSTNVIFISALPPSAVAAARHMYHRLHSRALNTPIVIGIWRRDADLNELSERIHIAARDRIVTGLDTAVVELERILRPSAPAVDAPPGLPSPNPQNVR
jgi:hypothetical protein